MLRRPQKITFAEMRASGVRGPMIYCSDITARIGLRSAAIDGPMTCACLIWSRGLPARLAAGVVPMSGRIPGPLAQKNKILAASDKKSEKYSD